MARNQSINAVRAERHIDEIDENIIVNRTATLQHCNNLVKAFYHYNQRKGAALMLTPLTFLPFHDGYYLNFSISHSLKLHEETGKRQNGNITTLTILRPSSFLTL